MNTLSVLEIANHLMNLATEAENTLRPDADIHNTWHFYTKQHHFTICCLTVSHMIHRALFISAWTPQLLPNTQKGCRLSSEQFLRLHMQDVGGWWASYCRWLFDVTSRTTWRVVVCQQQHAAASQSGYHICHHYKQLALNELLRALVLSAGHFICNFII